ncbi:MAG: tyrosine-type recombinase/integrase [Peptoniphilus harei]|nr:tyrosine-type recombinase/integrase [Peptoniphilus harei]
MKNLVITEIMQEMVGYLNNEQLEKLEETLNYTFWNKDIVEKDESKIDYEIDYLAEFLSAKKVEGCSERTISYYKSTINKMLESLNKPVRRIETSDLRSYIASYANTNKVSKTTLDNIRRIISSFFSWLEEENHIIKSPARRIHKIRTGATVKAVYTDEELELLRDSCNNIRDLAIIDFLSSTGVRIGELTKINISDIDFDKRECIVLGKGNKERIVYFDARSKIHILDYIESRVDDNEALFVSLNKPHNRLKISGVEIRLRNLGKKLNIAKVHPHKFRRTLATKAIDKGMPIEQVQTLLGHTKIDTTLHYAMVNQNNVKQSHRKYIG